MLRLTDITKDYVSGDLVVHALRGVSLDFRKSEFVSVLGPSGCGKTTLLNIMGGLDKYTSGDLHINGISTKDYTSRDWDNYRNNSIGFIFQSYNLIAHQSVLANVELALTLSGVGKKERTERAKQALIRVGLENEIYKKPNQLSGGQMQRVAIARAIVNDPEIILADEPTGALDSETSLQVMDILKEIATDRLVIMVTHNPDLAEKYSTRIIKMEDGLIVADSNPLSEKELSEIREKETEVLEEKKLEKNKVQKKKRKKKRKKKASMSLLTAFSLSLKNLFTKKARTILVSIAGSIGIIGIALIMSVSAGFQGYIDNIQRDTLSSSPITLSSQALDVMEMATSYMSRTDDKAEKYPNKDTITSDSQMQDMVDKFIGSMKSYDLTSFKAYMEENIDNNKIHGYSYSYSVPLEFYGNGEIIHDNYYDTEGVGNYRQLYPYDTSRIQPEIFGDSADMLYSTLFTIFGNMNPFSKTMVKSENGNLVNNWDLVKTQYDLIDGDWATDGEKGEMLLVVDEYNRISDATLFALGLRSEGYVLYVMFENMLLTNRLDIGAILGAIGKTPADIGLDKGEYSTWAEYFNNNEQEKDKTVLFLANNLMNVNFVVSEVKKEIVDGQKNEIKFSDIYDVDYKIMTTSAKYKLDDNGVYVEKSEQEISNYLKSNATDTLKVEITGVIRLKKGVNSGCLDEGLVYQNELTDWLIDTNNSSSIFADIELGNTANPNADLNRFKEIYVNIGEDYSSVKSSLNYVNKARPDSIAIYASNFDNKDYVTGFIDEYNKLAKLSDTDQYEEVEYSDVMGSLFTSVSKIVNAISYVLIAFVSISLVVSSIMIGIITYISVLERTKEIGILRSIGASKGNVGTVFNAEALIIGFAGGFLGVMIAVLLNLPITALLTKLTGTTILVRLPWSSGFILMFISMLLTTIAGLIPSRMASKKDPVIALRSAG